MFKGGLFKHHDESDHDGGMAMEIKMEPW